MLEIMASIRGEDTRKAAAEHTAAKQLNVKKEINDEKGRSIRLR